MSGLNIKVADLQISDFRAPECCFLWWHTEKTFSFWGPCPQTPTTGFAPGPHWGPTAAPRSPHHFPPFSLFPSPMSENQGWIPSLLLTRWTALPLGHQYCCVKSRVGSCLLLLTRWTALPLGAAHKVDRLTSRSPVLLSQNQGWIPSLLLTRWTALPLGAAHKVDRLTSRSPVLLSQKQGWIPSLLLFTRWTALPLGHLYCCVSVATNSIV